MFRFTIRELVMLTAIVGLALGWWANEREHRALIRQFETDTKSAFRWRGCAEILGEILEKEGWTITWNEQLVRFDAHWDQKNAKPRPVMSSVSTGLPISPGHSN